MVLDGQPERGERMLGQCKSHHKPEENRTSELGAWDQVGDEGLSLELASWFAHPFHEVLKTVAHKPEVLDIKQHLRFHFNCVGQPLSEEIDEE